MAKVWFPPVLQQTTQQEIMEFQADTLQALLDCLFERFPSLKAKMIRVDGQLNEFLLLALNDHVLQAKNYQQVKLNEADKVQFLTAISGG